MPAEAGNQFWRLRSRHGRTKLFANPQLLWEAAVEFFEWHEQHPFEIKKPFCSNGEIVYGIIEKPRAMTISGFCMYVGCDEKYLKDFLYQLPPNDPNYEGFTAVIAEIKAAIYNQKFSAAAVDLMNANLIARELGIRDNVDTTSGGEKITNAPPQITIQNVSNLPPLTSDEPEV